MYQILTKAEYEKFVETGNYGENVRVEDINPDGEVAWVMWEGGERECRIAPITSQK